MHQREPLSILAILLTYRYLPRVYIQGQNKHKVAVKYRGAMIWNSLLDSSKENKLLWLFKRKLKCLVQQKYTDST